jgi:polysaccharide biosynthesis protein PslG
MKISPITILTALVGLSLTATVHADSFPSDVLPQSAGIQLKNHNNSDTNLAELQELGFKYVRRGFVWFNIEKTPGEYHFEEYDALVDNAEKRGMHVLGCIALNNGKFPGVKEAAGREAFAKFAATVVARYKGRPVIWEIWNEPNIATFWGKHGKANTTAFADEYSEFVKVVAPAMRKANPDAIIIAGSVNLYEASFAWMKRCFDNGILKTGINGWSVHPYSTKSPEDHLLYYTRIRQMFVDHGVPADFPLLNTERGYPIGKAEGYAGGDPALSKEYQSWHLVRQYLTDVLAGIKLSIWYEWSGNDGFALKTSKGNMPSMQAARTLLHQLDGYTYTRRLDLGSTQDYALVFTKPDGAAKLVAWTTPPSKESPDKIVEHDVSIPVQATGQLDRYDIYGMPESIAIRNGTVTLHLTGAPQYLTVRP